MFWLRNKKIIFRLRTLKLSPGSRPEQQQILDLQEPYHYLRTDSGKGHTGGEEVIHITGRNLAKDSAVKKHNNLQSGNHQVSILFQ